MPFSPSSINSSHNRSEYPYTFWQSSGH